MANIIKSINFAYARDNLLRDTARMAASESVKFFKDSFVKGGFTDSSLQKWENGSNLFMSDGNKGLAPKRGNKTMYTTGKLMQSIRKIEETNKRVIVGSDSNYAEYHNNGATITVTARMKKWWWWQYSKFAKVEKSKTKKGKASNSAKNRKIEARAEYCKRMALMKVGTKIRIPKRQFIGESQALMAKLDTELQTKIQDYWEKA